jgi:replicative DNA helicase
VNRIESTILRSLMYDDEYTRKVIPFISEAYFTEPIEKHLFEHIKTFVNSYTNLPSTETLIIELDNAGGMSQDEFDQTVAYIKELEEEKHVIKTDAKWLLDQTEAWCQERAIHNAVINVINILDDKQGRKAKGGIPKLLQEALAVSFDPNVGHDYFLDAGSRFDFYNTVEKRIPFHLSWFNKVTRDGVPQKTLNIILGGVNVGKSLVLCDFAAGYLKLGKNVLYITLEMAEERIAERIDAHLLGTAVNSLKSLERDKYISRIEKIQGKTTGRLFIKEYPTASAHVGHFRHLLNELALKKHFVPDVIMIDYLNICMSSRVKAGAAGGMYEMVKSIAEELRGLAVEFEVPIWSATQMNRAGMNNSDPELTNTSESFGLPATADFMFALVVDDALIEQNLMMVKILKNRYNDATQNRKFFIGVDRPKMMLYDVDDAIQKGLTDAGHTTEAIVEPGATRRMAFDDDDDEAIFARPGKSGVTFGSVGFGTKKIAATRAKVLTT